MTTGPDLSPSAQALADTTVTFVKAFDAWMRRASFARAGESVPRLRLLNELHCNGPRKMADLAVSLGVTPRNVTALVDALEAEDLVRRSAHSTDRRITIVEITGGAATVAHQVAAFQAEMASLFDDLSDEERRTLSQVLTSLEARIQVAGAHPEANS